MPLTRPSYRTSAAIALLGVLVAVLPLPLASQINSKSGILENLEGIIVLVRPAERSPFFEAVPEGSEDPTAQLVSFPHSSGVELLIEFPKLTMLDEINSVMRSGARDSGSLQKSPPKGRRLRFREWITDSPATAVPYRYFLFCGLLLFFSAAFVALFSRRNDLSAPNSDA